jgi:hypothetical protein
MSKTAHDAILAQHRAMSGVRMGRNGCPIYPTQPLYRRVNLSNMDAPVPGERTDVKIELAQFVLLMLLGAIGGSVVALCTW